MSSSTAARRIATAPHPQLRELLAEVPARINDFLGKAVALVRERFGGKIGYASIPFEGVDWTPFDFISVDAYRTIEIADRYRDDIRALAAQGKPVAITEFGCTTHRGAADKGSRGGMIVEWDGATAIRLNGDYTRDESEQVTYLRELLDIFNAEDVDTAFAYAFASYHLPHRDAPREDLDMAGYGVVKVFEDRRGHTMAIPTPTWLGNPSPRSPLSPTITAADRASLPASLTTLGAASPIDQKAAMWSSS